MPTHAGRYLEESYWSWLLTEVLPEIDAQGVAGPAGRPAGYMDSGRGRLAVNVVRVWVRYFLGEEVCTPAAPPLSVAA
jgi:hypothetical protein